MKLHWFLQQLMLDHLDTKNRLKLLNDTFPLQTLF